MENKKNTAQRVKEYISSHDRLIDLLDVDVIEVSPGYAKVALTVKEKHLNAAEVCHGECFLHWLILLLLWQATAMDLLPWL